MGNSLTLYIVAAAPIAAIAIAANAAPVQWDVNGHYYDFLQTPAGLSSEEDAATRSHLGLQGYVATVTSQSEQDFLNAIWPGDTSYQISGKDIRSEGSFIYDGGPEDGQPLAYTNWGNGEPNNLMDEDFIEAWFGNDPAGAWNDFTLYGGPYVIEYGGLEPNGTVIPVPASLPLLAAGLAAFAVMCRRAA